MITVTHQTIRRPKRIQKRVRRSTIPPSLKILGVQTPRRRRTSPIYTTPKPDREVKCKQGAKPLTRDCLPLPEILRILGKDRKTARPMSTYTTTAGNFFWKRVIMTTSKTVKNKSPTRSTDDKQLIQKISQRFWKIDISQIRNWKYVYVCVVAEYSQR